MTLREQTVMKFAKVMQLPPIKRLVQHGREPRTAVYTLEFAGGTRVRVGTIKVLWSQAELAKVLAVTVGVVAPPIDPADWRYVIAALINNATDVEELDDESFATVVREWLTDYLNGASKADSDGATAHGYPFHSGGEVHVAAQHLAKYVRREHHEHVELHALRQALRDLGFEVRRVSYRKGDRVSSRSYYVVSAAHLDIPSKDGHG